MRKLMAAVAVLIALTGCMVGPDYKRPTVDTPASWRVEEKEAKDVANTAWWEQFNDPSLNELIATAIRENKDLKVATYRVDEFMGRLINTRAPLFPQAGAAGSVAESRLTQKGQEPLPSSVNNPATIYSASLNATWEIDLWGKIRRSTEAARADLLGSSEARSAVILTLVTQVAGAYVNLLDLDRLLEVAKETAKSREGSYNIFKLRFDAGIISELELSQAKSQYEQALSTIPPIENAIAQQENDLSVLLGRNPGPIPRGKTIDGLSLPAVPRGLPSDLLERRPDIRQAEQDLIAANARIGAAKAQYYPSISLTGALGTSSVQLSSLFSGPARTWNWAANTSLPIFTGGAIYGQVKASEAIRNEALFQYQKAIQNAFRDVEDALIDQRRTREQLEALDSQVKTLHTYASVARLRYENGYTSYVEVLDAERSLFDAELAYTHTKGELFRALVDLYKAMGGGWVVEADKMASHEEGKK